MTRFVEMLPIFKCTCEAWLLAPEPGDRTTCAICGTSWWRGMQRPDEMHVGEQEHKSIIVIPELLIPLTSNMILNNGMVYFR